MNLTEEVRALGPRPVARPGVWNQDAHAWFVRYVALAGFGSGRTVLPKMVRR